jgi:Resolvase, N terminal domain
MSTEHQQYSTENQREIIRQYAEHRGMVIVRTYTDAGKCGLRRNLMFYVAMCAALACSLISSGLRAYAAFDDRAVIQADRSLTDELRRAVLSGVFPSIQPDNPADAVSLQI